MSKKINKKIIKFLFLIIALVIIGYHCYSHYMVSKFYKCINEGNTNEIIACIEKMPDVNMLDICIPLYKIRGIMLQNAANKGYPLYYAVWMQADISVMEALFERGADPNKKDYDTPFECLFFREQEDMYEKVKLFVEYGADISIASFIIPVLDQLSQNEKEERMKTVIYLWECGLDEWEYVGTKYERTILHEAAERVDADNLKILYENEKRPMYDLLNEKDANGETPLFYAIRGEKFDNCRFLIEKGADISIQNNEGKTAYDVAVELGYEEYMAILNSVPGKMSYSVEEVNDKYVVSITNNHGKTIFEDTYNAYPVVLPIGENTVSVTIGAGDHWTTRFINGKTNRISDAFANISACSEQLVVYGIYEDGELKIIIRDIYDKEKVYKEIIDTFPVVAVGSYLIKEAQIIDDHTVHLTYYVNNDWEEKEEIIVLD